jgi:TPR repeat protein
VGCVRPDQPDVIVTLRYAQRTALAEVIPALQQKVSSFLDSLRFLPANSAVMQQARVAVRSEAPGEAVGLLLPIAAEGDGEAALFLGNIYLYGRGLPHDFPAARKWLGLAAQDGHAEAMYNIGAIYDKGLGVPRDVAEAIKWFTRAADQRDVQAQLNIALLYLNGDGVPKDIGLAEAWLKRAAGNGSKRAQGILSAGKYKEQ